MLEALGGLLVIFVALLGIVILIAFGLMKWRPEMEFSRRMKRLVDMYKLRTQPEEVLGVEAVAPTAPRPTRVSRATKSLRDLKAGDKLMYADQLYTVVARYRIQPMRQPDGKGDFVSEGKPYVGYFVYPVLDDPQSKPGEGYLLAELPLQDLSQTGWFFLAHRSYDEKQGKGIYEAAKAYGLHDRTDPFTLDLDGESGRWRVADIGTNQINTTDNGGMFEGSVRVAHVLCWSDTLAHEDPNGAMVWLDLRPELSDGRGADWLGTGSLIDPQGVRLL